MPHSALFRKVCPRKSDEVRRGEGQERAGPSASLGIPIASRNRGVKVQLPQKLQQSVPLPTCLGLPEPPEPWWDGAGERLPPPPAVLHPPGWAEDGVKGHRTRRSWEMSDLASLTRRTPDWTVGEPSFTPRSCFSTSLTLPKGISPPVPSSPGFLGEKAPGLGPKSLKTIFPGGVIYIIYIYI